MNQPGDLIEAYVAAADGREVVRTWYAQTAPTDCLLDAVAIQLAHDFVNRRIGFLAANGLLNQLMPLIGFEAAPRTFWAYYTAFESHETSDDPESTARSEVAALLK
jgi:hypothetical protein